MRGIPRAPFKQLGIKQYNESMNINERIGALVATWRKRSRLSQDALAQLLGLQQAAISKIETGKQTLTVEQLLRITETCDITFEEVVEQLSTIKAKEYKPLWERIDE